MKLCRENYPESAVHVIKLDNPFPKYLEAGMIVHFPSLPLDGKKYFVQLETSLSKSSHEYQINPVYFEANSSFKYVELHFNAEPKQDLGDTHQITFVPLPIIALLTLAFFNREALSSWLNTAMEKWSRRSSATGNRNAQSSAQNYNTISDVDIDEIAEQIKNINSKGSKKPKPRKT